MKFSLAKLLFAALMLFNWSEAEHLKSTVVRAELENNDSRALQDSSNIEEQISELEATLASLQRRRNRRRRDGLWVRGLNRRIRQIQSEIEALEDQLNNAPDIDPNAPLVTLDELAQLAIDQGLTLDDFEETFSAISVEELLSRTSTVFSRFNDFFARNLRSPDRIGGRRDEIDALRVQTAADLGVRIEV